MYLFRCAASWLLYWAGDATWNLSARVFRYRLPGLYGSYNRLMLWSFAIQGTQTCGPWRDAPELQ